MYCTRCGSGLESDAIFCTKCGTRVDPLNATGGPSVPSTNLPPDTAAPGRAGLIVGLGVSAIAMFGPLTGIPAWIMGRRDLKAIDEGLISNSARSLTNTGRILGMIGTFVSIGFVIIIGAAIAVGISMNSGESIAANRKAILTDVATIGANAYAYRCKPSEDGGGGGSYSGFPIELEGKWGSGNVNAFYRIERADQYRFILVATSRQVAEATVRVVYDENGKVAFGPEATGF